MLYRAARLFELTSQHAYFEGAPGDFITWQPSAETRETLAHFRLLFRPVLNGAVVLHEVDTRLEGSIPVVSLTPELELTFVGHARNRHFLSYSSLPPRSGTTLFFSNRAGHEEDGTKFLHPDPFAGPGEQVRWVAEAFDFRLATPAPEPVFEVRSLSGRTVHRTVLRAEAGAVSGRLQLTHAPPGAYDLVLDGAPRERVYMDPSFAADPPAAVAVVSARTLAPEMSFLGADGLPVAAPPQYVMAYAAAATVWRYVVVPRTDTSLDENRIEVRDEGGPGGSARFHFAVTGPKAPLADGTPAVVFESTDAIEFRALPYRGIRLRTRAEEDAPFVTAIPDLPNPAPGALSLTSTPARPVSEVFTYL